MNIPIYGLPVDESARTQIETCANHPLAVGAAMMADHHQGYSMPIGGVVAYKDAVSPSGAGYDIACGNKAVKLDVGFSDIKNDIEKLTDAVYKQLSFGVGLENDTLVDHELFDSPLWNQEPMKSLKDKARKQLGTIGSGNHFVNIMVDDNGKIWIGIHFGSRGFGHGVATFFLKEAGSKDGIMAEPTVLKLGTSIGDDYWEAMNLAGQYAYAGRDWVCDKVASIIGGNIIDSVHNHHNFCWKEKHFGEELVVVRKGATPAKPGERGFVGGSMGDNSVILEGIDTPENQEVFYSTVHGAGRVMSRTKAAGKFNYKTRTRDGSGMISTQMMQDWLKEKNVILRGGGTDESPQVYKRLPEVLDHHKSMVRILNVLRPLGVCMAGDEIIDPYKD